MTTHTVILKKEHFPEDLSEESVRNAYLSNPCIMDKALLEQFPELALHDMGGGLVNERKRGIFGKIGGWSCQTAKEMAKLLETDSSYSQTFVIKPI